MTQEPARHALYARLEEVLGDEHAATLMTHLPSQPTEELATKGHLDRVEAGLRAHVDRVESGLRADMERVESGLRADIERLESVVRAEISRLDGRIDNLEKRFDGMERMFVELTAEVRGVHGAMRDQFCSYSILAVSAMTALTGIFATFVAVAT